VSQSKQISEAIMKLNKLYRSVFDQYLKDFTLTKAQLMVIGEIYEQRKTIGQITEAIQLSYSTVSGIIDRLERDGWIERVRDQEDRRVIWIQAKDKIREIRSTITTYHESIIAPILEEISTEEKEGILHSLQLMNSHLEKRMESK
jgi:DNA-binding MarR family transcriptional regulator